MSVWSSEDDGAERIQQVVSEAKADAFQRLDAIRAKTREVANLLRDAARYGGLNPDECTQLAALIDEESEWP